MLTIFFATLITAFSLYAENNIDRKDTPMNIVCITHADFETPGVIEDWALKNRHAFKIVKPYNGEMLPAE